MKLQTTIMNELKNRDNIEMISRNWTQMYDNAYAIMFKVNGHNVYRIILNVNGGLYFQCVQYAFDVNGDEFYDESVDYKCVRTKLEYEKVLSKWGAMIDDDDLVDDDYDNWTGYVIKWIDECELDDPNFTIYEK